MKHINIGIIIAQIWFSLPLLSKEELYDIESIFFPVTIHTILVLVFWLASCHTQKWIATFIRWTLPVSMTIWVELVFVLLLFCIAKLTSGIISPIYLYLWWCRSTIIITIPIAYIVNWYVLKMFNYSVQEFSRRYLNVKNVCMALLIVMAIIGGVWYLFAPEPMGECDYSIGKVVSKYKDNERDTVITVVYKIDKCQHYITMPYNHPCEVGDCYRIKYSIEKPGLMEVIWEEGKQECPIEEDDSSC